MEGLLLGGAGPVGLYMGDGQVGDALPSMRFVTAIFLLSDAEDADAHLLCVKLLLKQRTQNGGPDFTDGFLDCSCYRSIARVYGETLYLHRCLQHVKGNLKSAAKAKDEETKCRRLHDDDLLRRLVDFCEFAAFLPSNQEFDACMRSVVHRLESKGSPGAWDEKAMATYMRTYLLDESAGFFRAAWASGYGCVPLGLTTFAPSAIEANWRVVKNFLPAGYQD